MAVEGEVIGVTLPAAELALGLAGAAGMLAYRRDRRAVRRTHALSLEQARHEARNLLELVRQGADPKVARVEARLSTAEASRETASLGAFDALLDA